MMVKCLQTHPDPENMTAASLTFFDHVQMTCFGQRQWTARPPSVSALEIVYDKVWYSKSLRTFFSLSDCAAATNADCSVVMVSSLTNK